MNPESYGIQLPQNWPSLCSSCIEISRNEFVYRTTISSSKTQISSKTGRITSPSKKPIPQYQGHGPHTPKKPIISKNMPKPRSPTRLRKAALPKRQVKSPTQGETFPSLIVDPATFNNLTEYDSVNAIQSMEQLRVQFRFVLCDD
ncbi:hypothetical protein BGZ93_011095 [Podila epicladia]|nr:hypothetical protein BGZ93_011095 [Podila epicladia]